MPQYICALIMDPIIFKNNRVSITILTDHGFEGTEEGSAAIKNLSEEIKNSPALQTPNTLTIDDNRIFIEYDQPAGKSVNQLTNIYCYCIQVAARQANTSVDMKSVSQSFRGR